MKARTLSDEQAMIFVTRIADLAYPVLIEEIKLREGKKPVAP